MSHHVIYYHFLGLYNCSFDIAKPPVSQVSRRCDIHLRPLSSPLISLDNIAFIWNSVISNMIANKKWKRTEHKTEIITWRETNGR